MLIFALTGFLISAGMLLSHPKTRFMEYAPLDMLGILLATVGAYPLLAAVAHWQAEKSPSRCIIICLGTLGVAVCAIVAWFLTALTWDSFFAILALIGYGMYQLMIVALLIFILFVMFLSGRYREWKISR
ncbi:MAG TPA: hypothetical protein DDW45_09630 [Gammaproteobacteria bacterium]|nr:hypothetical protein [Gammaproteobacteria bacterium]